MQQLEKLKSKLILNKREKTLLIIFLAVFFVFLYTKFLLAEQVNNIAVLRDKYTTLENKKNSLVNLGYHEPQRFLSEIEGIEKDIQVLYERVPGNADTPLVLVQLHEMLKKYALTAPNIIFSQVKDKGDYSSFLVSMDVSGSKLGVYGFLEEIENFPRLCKIVELELNPVGTYGIKARAVIEFYVLNEVRPDPLDYSFIGENDTAYPKDPFSLFKSSELMNGGPATDLSVKESSRETSSSNENQVVPNSSVLKG